MSNVKTKRQELQTKLKALYDSANRRTGGILGILRDAVEQFGETRGSEAAAGMAYYTLFSLFPLLLALVAAGSYLLDQQQVFLEVVNLVSNAFPISQNLIQENLKQVLELRGAVGLIGLVVTFWSASGAFTILTRNINRAWTQTEPRGFLANRLVALGMVGVLALLLALSILSSVILDMLSRYEVPLVSLEALYGTPLWTTISELVPWLVIFGLFLALYRWVPNAKVRRSAAFWGALTVALAWVVVTNVFSWIVGSGLVRYRIVYGSLGIVVALLFWIYISSWMILFDAHLCAAISRGANPNGE
jgi:membrane protein